MKKLIAFVLCLFLCSTAYATKEFAKKFPTDTPLEVYTPNNPPPGGTPGGSNEDIQFNDSGSFGGNHGFVYFKNTHKTIQNANGVDDGTGAVNQVSGDRSCGGTATTCGGLTPGTQCNGQVGCGTTSNTCSSQVSAGTCSSPCAWNNSGVNCSSYNSDLTACADAASGAGSPNACTSTTCSDHSTSPGSNPSSCTSSFNGCTASITYACSNFTSSGSSTCNAQYNCSWSESNCSDFDSNFVSCNTTSGCSPIYTGDCSSFTNDPNCGGHNSEGCSYGGSNNCSIFSDATSCNNHNAVGCTTNTVDCSSLYNSSSDSACTAQPGCSATYAYDCSTLMDSGSCSGVEGCTWDGAACSGTGYSSCDGGTVFTSCSGTYGTCSGSYFTSCSGTYNGTCLGSTWDGTCSGTSCDCIGSYCSGQTPYYCNGNNSTCMGTADACSSFDSDPTGCANQLGCTANFSPAQSLNGDQDVTGNINITGDIDQTGSIISSTSNNDSITTTANLTLKGYDVLLETSNTNNTIDLSELNDSTSVVGHSLLAMSSNVDNYYSAPIHEFHTSGNVLEIYTFGRLSIASKNSALNAYQELLIEGSHIELGPNSSGDTDIAGGLVLAYSSKSTTYTTTSSNHYINATSGTFTITLMDATSPVGFGGLWYVIKNSGSGVITVNTTSAQTITLGTSVSSVTLAQGDVLDVQSTGSNWVGFKVPGIPTVGTISPFVTNFAFKNSTYTLASNDVTIKAPTGTFTATLPTASGKLGQIYIVKNSGTGVVTVGTTGGELIDGSTTKVLSNAGDYLLVQSDNTGWIIIGETGGSGSSPWTSSGGLIYPVVGTDNIVVHGSTNPDGLDMDIQSSTVANIGNSLGDIGLYGHTGKTVQLGSNNGHITLGNNGSTGDINLNSIDGINLTGKLFADVATTAHSSLNIPSSSGTNVTSPTSGDLWWNGTNLYFYNGSANKDLLSGGSGTVTSVGLSSPNKTISVASSPVTTSGVITADINWTDVNLIANINSGGINWNDINRLATINKGAINWININNIGNSNINWNDIVNGSMFGNGLNWNDINRLGKLNATGINWNDVNLSTSPLWTQSGTTTYSKTTQAVVTGTDTTALDTLTTHTTSNVNGSGVSIHSIPSGTGGITSFTKLCLPLSATPFVDISSNAYTVTNTNITLDTTNKVISAAGSAVSAGGTSDKLSIANVANFDIHTGSFTIGMFFRPNGHTGALFDKTNPSSPFQGYYLRYNNSTNKLEYYTGNNVLQITQSDTLTNGTWYYVELDSDGTTTTLYVGLAGAGQTAVSKGTTTATPTEFNSPLLLFNQSSTAPLNGNLQEFKFDKGTQIHSTSFPVPVLPWDTGSPNSYPAVTYYNGIVGGAVQTAQTYTDGSNSDAYTVKVANTVVEANTTSTKTVNINQVFKGTLTNTTSTTGIGWSVKTGANTACNTTCGSSACVFGFDTGLGGSDVVNCTSALADTCVCAGP